ncbi:hypothetical protein EYZ11_000484 [Aspergillus tanneri]|uniref:Uncharacterized protein n=1 Tax=Aspergillus tanneri TaxID=1220188 RepID=A0A4S3JWZ5_9EURO|nr:hypothetical protein EYZ11_000484 [Aspergillus tanneri]
MHIALAHRGATWVLKLDQAVINPVSLTNATITSMFEGSFKLVQKWSGWLLFNL